MKVILTMIILLLACGAAMAQRVTEYYVTPEDIEISFLGAAPPDGDWHIPEVLSINYSTEPLPEVHVDKTVIGNQTWEFALQDGMEMFEKATVVINIQSIPDGMFRTMQIRVRVRADASSGDTIVGPWSEVNTIKIIGKPGKPAQR